VEDPFAAIKRRIFGQSRFLLRGLARAQTEVSLATMVYNLKRMFNVLVGIQLQAVLPVFVLEENSGCLQPHL